MQSGFGRLRAAHLRLGAAGEDAAVRMFRNQECDILLRDYRMPKGEIDLILRDGLCLVFAEVKTRRAKTPEQAARLKGQLRPRQKRRIYRAAFTYLRQIGRPHVPYRFEQHIIEGNADDLSHNTPFLRLSELRGFSS